MIDLRFRPLEKFADVPGLKFFRSAFKMTYDKTLDLLEHELKQLRAHSITIEAGFKLDQIRNDGWPVSRALPSHPGLVLYFKNGKNEDLRFPSGRYKTYQANLHAIALTLESLRSIDRYGVTLGHQQYIGFILEAPKKRIPVGSYGASEPRLTLEDAAAFLFLHCNPPAFGANASATGVLIGAGDIIRDPDVFKKAYREAAAALHPDNPGSANEHKWNVLQEARGLLAAHHGIK